MLKQTLRWIGFILLLFSGNLFGGIEGGSAVIDITPSASLRMAGFAARKLPSQGTLNPLFARAFVLRSGERSVGFVVYDLIGTLGRAKNSELSARAKSDLGIDEVVIMATHTHSGPRLGASPTDAPLASYEKELFDKTLRVLREAKSNLEPVRLGVREGTVDLTYNRIRKLPDGKAEMVWENPAKEPLGPVEPKVLVLRADNLKGEPRFVIVNYACHPVILGSDNLRYSPDYPGAMCRIVENALAGGTRCIFINGACGDMNPYFADENDRPAERVQEVGQELAGEVLRVAKSISTEPDDSATCVTWKPTRFQAEGRWDLAKWASSAKDEASRKQIEDFSRKFQNLDLPISVVLLSSKIGFVGLPGEFFSAFQRMLREKSPVDHLLVAGYANDSFGYFPTLDAAALGGYGANDTATYVAPGTGEHMIIEALAGLDELTGRLRPLPSSPDDGYQH